MLNKTISTAVGLLATTLFSCKPPASSKSQALAVISDADISSVFDSIQSEMSSDKDFFPKVSAASGKSFASFASGISDHAKITPGAQQNLKVLDSKYGSMSNFLKSQSVSTGAINRSDVKSTLQLLAVKGVDSTPHDAAVAFKVALFLNHGDSSSLALKGSSGFGSAISSAGKALAPASEIINNSSSAAVNIQKAAGTAPTPPAPAAGAAAPSGAAPDANPAAPGGAQPEPTAPDSMTSPDPGATTQTLHATGGG